VKTVGNLLPGIGFALLLTACGDGGHHGLALRDVNRDGTIVILAFGDSITRGVGDGPDPHDTPPAPAGYPLRLQDLVGVTVIDDGNPGEQTSDGLPRLRRSLAANNPDYAIIMEGTIDVLSGETSQTVDNIQSMIDSVVEAGAVPILATITPICCDVESRHPQSVIQSYNGELRAVAKNRGVFLADFYAAFAGGLEADYDENKNLIHDPEGLHPTPAGYDLMAETVRAIF